MTDRRHEERMTMPGQPPTDEDLRNDAELTRQELAETVAALGEKVDVPGRVRDTVHESGQAIEHTGAVLVAKLPDPVEAKLAPAWRTVVHRPGLAVGGLTALIAVLVAWRQLRRH
ncbi:DUF3618 domain-containing protein [Actinophytocola sediminis]